jgi:hypothetical protein
MSDLRLVMQTPNQFGKILTNPEGASRPLKARAWPWLNDAKAPATNRIAAENGAANLKSVLANPQHDTTSIDPNLQPKRISTRGLDDCRFSRSFDLWSRRRVMLPIPSRHASDTHVGTGHLK